MFYFLTRHISINHLCWLNTPSITLSQVSIVLDLFVEPIVDTTFKPSKRDNRRSVLGIGTCHLPERNNVERPVNVIYNLNSFK